jgi:hypothetical protein
VGVCWVKESVEGEGGRVSCLCREREVFLLQALGKTVRPSTQGQARANGRGCHCPSGMSVSPAIGDLIKQAPGLGAEKHIPGRLGAHGWWGWPACLEGSQVGPPWKQKLGSTADACLYLRTLKYL